MKMITSSNTFVLQASDARDGQNMAVGHTVLRGLASGRMLSIMFLVFLVLFDLSDSAMAGKGKKCQQYGHSCLGGHGKRSSLPLINAAHLRAAAAAAAASDDATEDLFPNLSLHSPSTSSIVKNDDDDKFGGNDVDEQTLDEQIQRLLKTSPSHQSLAKAFHRQQKSAKNDDNDNQSWNRAELDGTMPSEDNLLKSSTYSLLVVPFRGVSLLHKTGGRLGKLAHSAYIE